MPRFCAAGASNRLKNVRAFGSADIICPHHHAIDIEKRCCASRRHLPAAAAGRRRRPRPGRAVRAGDGRDAAEPRSGRLAALAAHARRLGLQPARPDRPRQRAPAAARLVHPAAARPEPAGPAGPRRPDVHPESARLRAGGRRGDRGPPLGVPQDVRGHAGRHVPQPHPDAGHLRRQGLRHDERCAHPGARRADRRGRVGPHRGRLAPRLPLHERAHRGARTDRRRHHRLRALQGRRLLHLGPRPGDRRRAVAHGDHRRPRRAGRRYLGRPAGHVPGGRRRVDSRQLRPGAGPALLGDGAGQALGAAVARHRRRRALHEQRAGARSADRRAGLVLPVRARRVPRPRRVVRGRAHRSRRTPLAVQDGQAGHPVGNRPRHGRVRGGARPRLPDPGRRRSRRPAA